MMTSWLNLRFYPSIYLETLQKTMKNLCQVTQSLGQNLNLGPSKYKARLLTTLPQHLVMVHKFFIVAASTFWSTIDFPF
jgi:hypothetical protein